MKVFRDGFYTTLVYRFFFFTYMNGYLNTYVVKTSTELGSRI